MFSYHVQSFLVAVQLVTNILSNSISRDFQPVCSNAHCQGTQKILPNVDHVLLGQQGVWDVRLTGSKVTLKGWHAAIAMVMYAPDMPSAYF